LLLPKIKSDFGSGFSQNFDSGSERKTQNRGGVDSCAPDPWPPLADTPLGYRNRKVDIGGDLSNSSWRVISACHLSIKRQINNHCGKTSAFKIYSARTRLGCNHVWENHCKKFQWRDHSKPPPWHIGSRGVCGSCAPCR